MTTNDPFSPDNAAWQHDHLYLPLHRPAHWSTLPEGLEWVHDCVAHDRAPYGIIRTSRPLTPAEMDRFSLRAA